MTDIEKHISESAFLVNESRARNVPLSRDRYAHLWVSDSTRTLWEDFSRDVYPHDALELGVRNRFFLEHLESRVNSGALKTFVNVGAGFTSYPFLIEGQCRHIEIDHAHVIQYKSERIAAWQQEGLLPARQIDFLPADLNSEPDLKELADKLTPELEAGPSFVLLEGITYYLNMDMLQKLFDLFSRIQPRDSILAFDFWKPDFVDYAITVRFKKFFAERFGYSETDYNLIDTDFVRGLRGYECVEMTNVQEQEIALAGSSLLSDESELLPENYAVLRKL